MSHKHIVAEWEFRCDGCAKVTRVRTKLIPIGWVAITGNQIAWSSVQDFHGLNMHACSKHCALQVMTELCQEYTK